MKFIYACDIHGDINKYEELYRILKENNINTLVIGRRLITKESRLKSPNTKKVYKRVF